MSEWKEYLLQDLFDVQNGYAFKSGDFTQFDGFSLEVLKMGHIAKGGGLRKNPKKDFVPRSQNIEKWILNKNDIVMAMTDMKDNVVILGVPALIDLDNKYVLNQRVARLSLRRPDIANVFFIYNYLKWKDFILELQSKASSGVQVNLSTESIKKSLLSIPPLPEQKAIADVLSSLDDKIDLLHRQNKTLEAMAETLFRQWFVEEADEKWESVSFDKFFDFLEGPGIRNWQYTETGIPFINIRLISGGDIDISKANFVSSEEANGKYKHFHLKEGDMIVSTSGTLGKNAIVRSYHLPLILNTSVIRFRPRDGTSYSFMYQYLNSTAFQEHLEVSASGSVQANFGPTHLKQMSLLVPPKGVLSKFSFYVDPIYDKIRLNQHQIKNLVKLRDTLLPKLMSGEVRVAL